mmetsp:Transcript_10149/g.33842  ORF Transcript_10149/g.33842 Transcript_10149/m.33842 type:complete len:145 (-) Transcript_10149:1374-1808(-)
MRSQLQLLITESPRSAQVQLPKLRLDLISQKQRKAELILEEKPFQKCSSQMRNLLKTLKNQERKSLAQINNYRQRMKANQLLKALKEIRLQQQEKKKQSRQQEGEIQLSHRDKQLRHQLHETRLERGRNSPLNWTPWLPQRALS